MRAMTDTDHATERAPLTITSTATRYGDATVHVTPGRLTIGGGWNIDITLCAVVDSPEYGHNMVMLSGWGVRKDGSPSRQVRKPVVRLSALPVEIQQALIAERAR